MLSTILKPFRATASFLTNWNSEQTEGKALPRRVEGDHLVLFVHGLSGSALGTWTPMLKAFEADTELGDYAFDCYSYPTKLLRLPFGKRMAGIREIANGLRTYIESHYGDKKSLTLVGHSLGGVIVRQYVLEEIKSDRISRIKGVVLYATPHTGAALANIGKTLSRSHRHLAQLCKGSDILEIINSDWVKLKIEERVQALYIVGGCDAVVSKDSAAPYLGADNVRTLIEHGHTEVIKPTGKDDTRFMIMKTFIGRNSSVKRTENLIKERLTGDVLFDHYSLSCERYYIKRLSDSTLFNITRNSHAWVSGPPGLGKTASLRRLAETSGWQLNHVILDGYKGLTALELMREVCNFLCEKSGTEPNGIPRGVSYGDLLSYFRRALTKLSAGKVVAILVEEIPLSQGDEYSAFLDFAYNLTLSTDVQEQGARVIWLFSSIRNPRPDVPAGNPKFWERLQLVEFGPWNDDELSNLIDVICLELDLILNEDERDIVLKKAKGSPRFVKMLFRRKRNEYGATRLLQELLASVELDLA